MSQDACSESSSALIFGKRVPILGRGESKLTKFADGYFRLWCVRGMFGPKAGEVYCTIIREKVLSLDTSAELPWTLQERLDIACREIWKSPATGHALTAPDFISPATAEQIELWCDQHPREKRIEEGERSR